MFEVTTIRTLLPGPGGSGEGGGAPRVEVSTRRVGVVGRVVAGLVGMAVLAGLVVLAIVLAPLLLVGLAVVMVCVGVWLLRVWLRVRSLRRQMGGRRADEGRENVRVRGVGGP
jgi:hypothetical protein